jgi:hypothetical protein
MTEGDYNLVMILSPALFFTFLPIMVRATPVVDGIRHR